LSVLRMTIGNRRRLSRMCLAIFATLLFPAVGLPAVERTPAKPPSAPAMGQLKIEGKAIERLSLAKRIGKGDASSEKPLVLNSPGSTVSLPVGDYLLERIELKGGYVCNVPFRVFGPNNQELRAPQWLTIGPDQPCVLKIGAPLKATLRTYRQGRVILIAYDLLDSEGRRYASTKRGSPPRFTVSCDGREVASGSFEYG
jgi:hypothetical protein